MSPLSGSAAPCEGVAGDASPDAAGGFVAAPDAPGAVVAVPPPQAATMRARPVIAPSTRSFVFMSCVLLHENQWDGRRGRPLSSAKRGAGRTSDASPGRAASGMDLGQSPLTSRSCPTATQSTPG